MEKKLQFLRNKWLNKGINYRIVETIKGERQVVGFGCVSIVSIEPFSTNTIMVRLNVGQQSYEKTFFLRQRLRQIFNNYYNLSTHFQADRETHEKKNPDWAH